MSNIEKDIVFLVRAEKVSTGFLRPKTSKISIGDGRAEWIFYGAGTFTIHELKQKLPYFFKQLKDNK